MNEEDWIYRKAPSQEWREMKALVPEEVHGGVLRVAREYDVKVSRVVFRALEWWFAYGEIRKVERVVGARRPRSSAELAYLMLGVLAEGGQWRRRRVLERLGLIGGSTTAKNATRRLVRMGWARRVERGVLEITGEGLVELERHGER